MVNYIKWLFRKKVIKVFSGEINWIDEDYKTEYTFIIYDGYLGKSWEFIGNIEMSPTKLPSFAKVRVFMEMN